MHRSLRLTQASAFERVRNEGQVVKHPTLLVSWVRTELPHNRYGVIVSKRIGKAVIRNRLRRQLRACLRGLHPTLQQGYDIVLVTRSPLLQMDFHQMCHTLAKLAQKAGLG